THFFPKISPQFSRQPNDSKRSPPEGVYLSPADFHVHPLSAAKRRHSLAQRVSAGLEKETAECRRHGTGSHARAKGTFQPMKPRTTPKQYAQIHPGGPIHANKSHNI